MENRNDKNISELNKQLYEECVKESVDFDKVERLLVLGAEPLGYINADEIVYSEIIYGRNEDDDDDSTLVEITKMFLDHGMKIKCIDFEKEINSTDINPFWNIPYLSPEKAISVLRLLIDENIDFNSLNQLVDHCAIDSSMLTSELKNVAGWIRMLMFVASYEFIIKADEYLQQVINYDSNQYDVRRFADPFQFYITFDTSGHLQEYNNQGIVARIFERDTEKLVWKITL